MDWVLPGCSSLRRVGTPRRLGVLVLLNQALHFPSREASSHPFSFCNRYYFTRAAVNTGRVLFIYFFHMVQSLLLTGGLTPCASIYTSRQWGSNLGQLLLIYS